MRIKRVPPLSPVSVVSGACCRQLDPPSWRMLHLTRLQELTLSEDGAGDAMCDLLESSAPVLPAGLRILRQDGGDVIECLSGEIR